MTSKKESQDTCDSAAFEVAGYHDQNLFQIARSIHAMVAERDDVSSGFPKAVAEAFAR